MNTTPTSAAPGADEIWALSATEALTKFRTKELSPVEFLSAQIGRITTEDERINAVTEVLEEAVTSAKEAEKFYANAEPDDLAEAAATRPLLGLPVIAKEKHAIAGRTLTQGLVHERDTVAEADAAIVRRIRASGGFVHARATSPEFSCATVTHSPMWGVTRNPWNAELSPGGSSGGSGAALAAGFAPLATASDIAGSTRLPAAFTGTVGYKAPYGRIPGAQPLAADWYRGDGPMARTVADAALLARVMVGVDPSDHTTIASPGFLEGFDATSAEVVAGVSGKRIALCLRLGDYPVGEDIIRNTRAVASALEAAGAIVEEIELPWTGEGLFETAFTHYGNILAPAMRAATSGHEDTLADYTRRFMADTEAVAARHSLYAGLAAESAIQAELATGMDGFDVLLAPTSAVAGLEADGSYLNGITIDSTGVGRDDAGRGAGAGPDGCAGPGAGAGPDAGAGGVDGGGVRLDHYWQAHMTIPFNICNRVPIVNVPSGMADCGIPTGLQVVAHPFDDRAAFDVAAAVEQLVPWTGIAPG
ncbi:amidase [Brevibacterium marinum]|uniref:Aspartyl-tRNA(Asn)/glutamyl-tRNA(Gln) amidotransferase subunit A n=1 Tax=Brevibacterium marinum TaxID=418643 RepID=A0A846RND4_9MICO|nr:amidase [Brevibacterium marinum]NJC55229.1 aspartyl-tRNA(Asn)/glutamyl-tRNA(Gln) amidotransferase subunit A [Brevibacterium marinum]